MDTSEAPAADAEIIDAPVTDIVAPTGVTEPEPAPVAAEAAPAPAAEPQHPFWYRKEIEKERRRAAQLERQLEQERTQRPQPQRQAPPDPLEDPNAFYGHIEQRLEIQRVTDRLERSEDRFVDKHGDQSFEEVRDWLATRPDIEQWAIGQRDPWRAAHQQFNKEKLASEIGDNPEDWRSRERERIRQEVLAEMDGGSTAPTAPQMRPQLPASAASARNVRDATTGRFTPTPLSSATRNKY